MLAAARPEEAKGDEVTVREILDIAAERLQADTTISPEVEARLRYTIGESFSSLAAYDVAMGHLSRAHDLAVQTQEATSEQATEALSAMAQALWRQGRLAASLEINQQLLALTESSHGKHSPEYIEVLGNLANTFADMGEFSQAEPLLRESLALDRALSTPEAREGVAFSLNNLAAVLADQGKYSEAISLHRESLELRRQLFGDRSPAVVIALMNLGFAQAGTRAWTDAEATLREAVALADIVYGRNHSRTGAALINLSQPVAELGRTGEAVQLAKDALAVLERVEGRESFRAARARGQLGKLHIMNGEIEAGEAEMARGWQQLADALGPDSPRSKQAALGLAEHYAARGNSALATQWRIRASGSER